MSKKINVEILNQDGGTARIVQRPDGALALRLKDLDHYQSGDFAPDDMIPYDWPVPKPDPKKNADGTTTYSVRPDAFCAADLLWGWTVQLKPVGETREAVRLFLAQWPKGPQLPRKKARS